MVFASDRSGFADAAKPAFARVPDRFDKIKAVSEIAGLCRSQVYKGVKEGWFPKPVKIGAASRWSRREVEDWVAAQLAARDAA